MTDCCREVLAGRVPSEGYRIVCSCGERWTARRGTWVVEGGAR